MTELHRPRLERVAAFVPNTTVSVPELSEPLGLDRTQVRFFTRLLGLDRIAVAGDLDLADMLVEAGERALGDTDRDAVRFVVHGHTTQHVASPSRAMLDGVRRRLGLRDASVFGMSHVNCVVGLHGLRVARHLLHGVDHRHKVLVLTGDKILIPRVRLIPDTTILGDAAGACLVGHDPAGDRPLGHALNVLGRFYQCVECPPHLWADYKQAYVEGLAMAMLEAIKDARCDPGEITAVLPHNVNRLTWKRVCGNLGIPPDRIYLDNIPKYGHCYGSDPFINLSSARAAGRIGAGDIVLLTAAGLGAAFAATVVEIGEGTSS